MKICNMLINCMALSLVHFKDNSTHSAWDFPLETYNLCWSHKSPLGYCFYWAVSAQINMIAINTEVIMLVFLLFFPLLFYFCSSLIFKQIDETAKHIEYVSVVDFQMSLSQLSLINRLTFPHPNHPEEFYALLFLLARSNTVF